MGTGHTQGDLIREGAITSSESPRGSAGSLGLLDVGKDRRGRPFLPLAESPKAQLSLPGFPSGAAGDRFQLELEGILVGSHPLMCTARALISRFASQELPVLVLGETGTGKDLASQAIHRGSSRGGQRLVVTSLAGLGETARSELFGHERGAFTSATEAHQGVFLQAQGSSLLLDDIADAPRNVQPLLLRAIEKKRIRSVGGKGEVSVDTRIIATSNVSLEGEVRAGRFRQDLYFRLNVLTVVLPPLREHLADLEILVPHLLAREAGPGKEARRLAPGALDLLLGHPWEGNVRELENLMKSALALAGPEDDSISKESIRRLLAKEDSLAAAPAPSDAGPLDRAGLLELLEECEGNKRMLARRLGLWPWKLYALLREFGV